MVPEPDDPPAERPYSGRIAGGVHRFAVRVYYEDTDAGGVVYYANYLRFMERARTDMLALAGIDIAESAASGRGQFVVAEAALRYRRPARLGEALLIESRILEMRGAACVVQQEVIRDGQGVTTGRLTIVFTGADGRPKRLPPAWIEALGAVAGAALTA